MKELHRIGNFAVAIMDRHCWGVYKYQTVKKGKTEGQIKQIDFSYHHKSENAVEALAKRVAEEKAVDLKSYLAELKAVLKELKAIVKT